MEGFDFNCRSDNEVLYAASYTVDTLLEAFLQEIDVLLSTDNGTVLGMRYFGANVEQLLWKTSYNATTIGVNLGRQISENCLAGQHFKWTSAFSIVKGTGRDIGYLTINIKDINTNDDISSQQFIFK